MQETDGRARTVLIADDHPMMLRATKAVLEEENFEVLGMAKDGLQLISLVERFQPSLVLVDLRMPKLDGVGVAKRVREIAPETSVVIFTGHGDVAMAHNAIESGATGYVLKDAPEGELVRALECVLRGETYYDPTLSSELIKKGDAAVLTEREKQVLQLLSDGLSYGDIGKSLYLSPETVRTHVRKAMVKLDAVNKVKAVAIAIREGMLPSGA
jgi:DNA-binding NarL/FixJ family response regulator